MIRKIEKTDYPRLVEIWSSAVKSTHTFLNDEDFLHYEQQLPFYFEHVTLWGFEAKGGLRGFVGVAGDVLEMLFIHNDYRGQGIGKQLAMYVINNLAVRKVDVNEQNEQAVGFYKKNGFKLVKRSALDAEGKEYPILHLSL